MTSIYYDIRMEDTESIGEEKNIIEMMQDDDGSYSQWGEVSSLMYGLMIQFITEKASKKYPHVLFAIGGEGDGCHWIDYIRNGKHQEAFGELVFPDPYV